MNRLTRLLRLSRIATGWWPWQITDPIGPPATDGPVELKTADGDYLVTADTVYLGTPA